MARLYIRPKSVCSVKCLQTNARSEITHPKHLSLHNAETKQSEGSSVNKLTKSYPVKHFKDVPGPRGLPLVGTLWDYIKKDGFRFPKLFESYISRAKQYGIIYREKIGVYTNVVINDPDEYKKVIRDDAKTRCPIRLNLEPMTYYRQVRGIPLGLVNSQGEEWYKLRTVLSKKMLAPRVVGEYCGVMNGVGNDLIRRLTKLRRVQDGEVPELELELFKWSMESIGTLLFDHRIGCLDDNPPEEALEFIRNLLGFFSHMQELMFNLPVYKLYSTPTWREFEKNSDRIMAIGKKYVDMKIHRLFSTNSSDKMDGASEVTRESPTLLEYLLANETLTPEEATNSVVDMLIGSLETTSNATLWTLYNLARNPHTQLKLYEEIQAVLPPGDEITSSHLGNMHYVKACLKETFRLYPVAFTTSRIIQNDLEIAGYNIPKGSHVQANLAYMSKNPELFDDPGEFKPDRWLRSEGRVLKAQHSIPSLVFGHGPRMCIGRRFAEQEVYIAVTKVISKFRLEYHHAECEPVLYTVMNPDRPVRLKFIPRK